MALGTIAYDNDGLVDPSHFVIPGEQHFESITPIFKYERILNENRSLDEGRPVVDIVEVVQMRFSHDRNYSPVFPVDATYRTIRGRPITFAERWADQYRAFLSGDEQIAVGTPLEELKPYGITPAQISLCRAQNIHSIEALNQLEGVGRKRIGMVGNDIIPMAKKWEEARITALNNEHGDEIAKLKAEIEALKAKGEHPAQQEPAPVDDPYAGHSDAELKEMIEKATGAKPRGNPSRSTLLAMLSGGE